VAIVVDKGISNQPVSSVIPAIIKMTLTVSKITRIIFFNLATRGQKEFGLVLVILA